MTKILAIDDMMADLISLKTFLQDAFPDAVLYTETDGPKGIEMAIAKDPDVILLDILMPKIDGFEICRQLKEDKRVKDIPIIFITGINADRNIRIKALEVGAESFVSKPIEVSELTAQIKAMVKIKQANEQKRDEKDRLATLVFERTRELEESQIHFKNLADSGQALIWTANLDKKCDYFNQPWLDFTGRTFEQEKNYGWTEGVHPDDLKRCIETFENAFDKREKFRMEYRLLHCSGDYKWIDDLGSPRYNSKGDFVGYIGHCLDITESRNLMEHIIAAKEKAEKSNLLKTAFLNNISHEVRTPLNGILGFGSLLAEPGISEEEKERYFALMKSSSDRLINTITDYMNISLLVSGNLSANIAPVNISSIIDFSRNKFKELSGAKKLNFNFIVPGGSAELALKTDLDLIKIIIHHLLDNAIKFTEKGDVSIGFVTKEKSIEFFVRDTGSGIDREDQIQIFDLFTQRNLNESRVQQGSGLGLSIVKGILNLLGGNIRVESVNGIGSTFYFSLPFKMEDSKTLEEIQFQPVQKTEKLPVVLAVDDEETNSIYIEAVLRKYTSKIIKAVNGKEAVDICRSNPDISIVLMDIKMPVMNGFEATGIIKSFRKDLPIIAVTAYAMAEDEKIALDAGCDDYLAKPFTYSRLIEKVRKYTS